MERGRERERKGEREESVRPVSLRDSEREMESGRERERERERWREREREGEGERARERKQHVNHTLWAAQEKAHAAVDISMQHLVEQEGEGTVLSNHPSECRHFSPTQTQTTL